MDPGRDLARIGLDPDGAYSPTRATAERLQRAHVRSVPFETLSITGDPFGHRDGDGVSLDVSDLYEKIVERRRGGFCYELNGLFGWLLAELGFDAERVAARVVTGDGSPPANHLTHVVALGRRYVVDVGLGIPTMRLPLPLDGDARTDAAGVEWRVDECDRPDADYVVRFREPGRESGAARDWTDRYLFRDVPRQMAYFEATCEYLATAPESPFTGDPVVTIATDAGHAKLTTTTLSRGVGGELDETTVAEDEWYDVAAREFGLHYEPDDQGAA